MNGCWALLAAINKSENFASAQQGIILQAAAASNAPNTMGHALVPKDSDCCAKASQSFVLVQTLVTPGTGVRPFDTGTV